MGCGRHGSNIEELGGWRMNMLFHGSDVVVQAPLAKVGRKKVDFGQGFYLTLLRVCTSY